MIIDNHWRVLRNHPDKKKNVKIILCHKNVVGIHIVLNCTFVRKKVTSYHWLENQTIIST